MTRQTDPLRGREIIERWCALSERRLDYLTDLFETGRWRRFHSEAEFLENIQEAKTATETWRRLAAQEAGPDNMPVTWSWLDRPGGAQPARRSVLPEHPQKSVSPAAAPQNAIASIPAPAAMSPDGATTMVPDAMPGDFDWQSALDQRVILDRYPILRNPI